MDQRTDRIAQDLTDIDQTREAIADKLDLVEQRVQKTVRAAKSTVSEVVEKIVDSTETVRGKAEDLIDHTTRAVNPSELMKAHPWLIFGGAIVLGYGLGRVEARRLTAASEDFRLPTALGSSVDHPGPDSQRKSRINLWDDLVAQIQDEIEDLKAAISKTGLEFIHDVVTKALLPALAEPLKSSSSRDHQSWNPGGRH
jgi:hypothetical protein